MTETAWEPFGLTDDERDEYRVLIADVPSWMRESLVAWVLRQLTRYNGGYYMATQGREIQVACRVNLGIDASASGLAGFEVQVSYSSLRPGELLRVVDYLVGQTPGVDRAATEADLDDLLVRARSKWTIGERSAGRRGLVTRVPAGVQDAVEATIATAGTAGRLLARAWADVHGLEPDNSAGYARAVRAVEVAALTTMSFKKAEPTLGDVIRQMENDGDWRLPMRQHFKAPTADVVLGMLRTIWRGHRDRHGTPDNSDGTPDYSDVTHEEARAAVMLAATLVDWFTSGAIARRPTE